MHQALAKFLALPIVETMEFMELSPDEFNDFKSQSLEIARSQYQSLLSGREEVVIRLLSEVWSSCFPSAEYSKGPHYAFSLRESDKQIGYIWYEIKQELGAKVLHLWELLVRPEVRGQGYGTKAMQHLETIANQHSVQAIELSVLANNAAAIALYQSAGFQTQSLKMSKALS